MKTTEEVYQLGPQNNNIQPRKDKIEGIFISQGSA